MRVSSGWNTDYGKKKFDMSLDEDDLRRLLQAQEIPVEWAEQLTVDEAFSLLHHAAEDKAMTLLGLEVPSMKPELGPQILAHRKALARTLEAVRGRLGTGDPREKEAGSEQA